MNREVRRRVLLAPLAIWIGLMCLLTLTVTYAYWPAAPIKPEVGLAIGVSKALLIALFFMQLRNSASLVKLASMAGLLWGSLLFILSFADILTR